ncbi:hypothetical protein GM3709_1206 [Geminocystis sp. NIES-3709]|nr:hypothetical protein GM3709_1206 [Geminocystis sp. NIES-3709]
MLTAFNPKLNFGREKIFIFYLFLKKYCFSFIVIKLSTLFDKIIIDRIL